MHLRKLSFREAENFTKCQRYDWSPLFLLINTFINYLSIIIFTHLYNAFLAKDLLCFYLKYFSHALFYMYGYLVAGMTAPPVNAYKGWKRC